MGEIETYENETGTWGWDAAGRLHCSPCGGSTQVPCPRADIRGPYDDGQGQYWMCQDCTEPVTARGRGHYPISCPTCER